MIDFAVLDLLLAAEVAEREREVRALVRCSRLRSSGDRLRAKVAARLTTLALRLDGESARSLLARDVRSAVELPPAYPSI